MAKSVISYDKGQNRPQEEKILRVDHRCGMARIRAWAVTRRQLRQAQPVFAAVHVR